MPKDGLQNGDGNTAKYAYILGWAPGPTATPPATGQIAADTVSLFEFGKTWTSWGADPAVVTTTATTDYSYFVLKGGDASADAGYTYVLAVTKQSDGSYALSGWENGSSSTDVVNSTSYTFTGPLTAVVGTAMTVSVAANGSGPATDTVITFSDAGAGGTFSAASVTLPKDSTGAVSASYTPANAGTVSLSTTNSTGLTNPSPLSVTVVAEAAPSTTYALSGPTTAVAGTPVTLSLTPDGTGPSADTTVTLSDNGAGGTFSPATAVFTAGSSVTDTVFYTAVSSGTISISATNNTGLTNPGALSVQVASPPLSMGTTTVTTDATTDIPSITTTPSGGVSPTFLIFRGPQGISTSALSQIASVSTLPYVDTDAPCGDLQYCITATDSSIGTAVLDGGVADVTIATKADTSDLSIDSATYHFIDRPDVIARMDIYGDMPVGRGTASTDCVVQYSVAGKVAFTLNGSAKVNGQSSSDDPKKGYSIKLTTKSGKKTQVKFGSWNAQSKLSLKAYYLDRSMCRDIVANRFWCDIRRVGTYPDNMIFPADAVGANGATGSQPASAPMSTDGFPVKLYVNGTYQGLYIERTGGDNDDWLIDDSNPDHYLLQFDHAGVADWQNCNWYAGFNYEQWDVASPAMSGYADQGDFQTSNPTQWAAVTRLFSFIESAGSSSVSFAADAATYMNVASWIDYLLFSEVVANSDGVANNLYLASWDAKTWHVMAYDLDETFGTYWEHTASSRDPVTIGLVTQATSYSTNGNGVWMLFWNTMQPQLTSRYRELRDAGVISTDHVLSLFRGFASAFGDDELMNDYQVWGFNDQASMAYVMDWVSRRITYLDGVFSYTAGI
ncbi:hypothetical protein AA21952_1088 [Acetobacter oeni LMG 21952]|nr:hypothetical protein AA21952_1088 [Acetobacter oeni LMG 21952]